MLKHRTKQIERWTKQVPALGGEWTHWWLDGDGGVLLVTSDLSELLQAVEANYGKSLRICVLRARLTPEGDAFSDESCRYVVADYVEDKITGWA